MLFRIHLPLNPYAMIQPVPIPPNLMVMHQSCFWHLIFLQGFLANFVKKIREFHTNYIKYLETSM